MNVTHMVDLSHLPDSIINYILLWVKHFRSQAATSIQRSFRQKRRVRLGAQYRLLFARETLDYFL